MLPVSISSLRPAADAQGRHIQLLRPELAGAAGGGSRSRALRDPRLDLAVHELIYRKTALRVQAQSSAERGAEPRYGSAPKVFPKAARGTEDLAERIQRRAAMVARHSH